MNQEMLYKGNWFKLPPKNNKGSRDYERKSYKKTQKGTRKKRG